MKQTLIAPSLLAADFANLQKDIEMVNNSEADWFHIDVMDGDFAPNITIGPVVIKCIRKVTKLPLDVHLMISKPERYIDNFIDAGSDMITVHIETISCADIRIKSLQLKARGVRFGVSLNPDTALEKIKGVLDCIDFVLVMSVRPGFSGQEFIDASVEKVRQLRAVFDGDIAVDGGINNLTAKKVIEAGANILAAGSYVFKAQDPRAAIEKIKNMLQVKVI